MRDPAPREDGLCVVDKRKVPVLARRMGDPFCRSTCCRRYYAVVFPSELIDARTKHPNGKEIRK